MTWYPNVSYDKKYPKIFNSEHERVKKVLGNVKIEHFGSTAVPNLSGKGYIDIYVVVKKEKLIQVSKILETKLGYIFKPNAGVPNGRLFHERKTAQAIFHLHLTYEKNQDYIKDLAFRDYLRKHPKDAQKYSEVKKLASKKANKAESKEEAKEIYMNTKDDFIQKILKKALRN